MRTADEQRATSPSGSAWSALKPAAPDADGERDDGSAAAEDLLDAGVEVPEWVYEYGQGMGEKEGRSTNWVQGCEATADSHPARHNLGE